MDQQTHLVACSQDSVPHPSNTQPDAVAGSTEFGSAIYCAGSPQGYAEAAEWYLKAAQQNHRLAQYNLGVMLESGQGLERDDKSAVMWIRRSANGGDAGAQFNLGNRCLRDSIGGSDVDSAESRIEAYKWFKLAAGQGYGDSLNSSDSATLRMTRDEVAEGDRRVKSFASS